VVKADGTYRTKTIRDEPEGASRMKKKNKKGEKLIQSKIEN